MHTNIGSPFPNYAQELLLNTALMRKDVAIAAWKQWRQEVVFELDVDHGSHRLLPLVYQNLRAFDYSDDLVSGRLKGIYRKSWLENQQLFYKTGKVLEVLHERGVKTAVLKGIALTELVYQNYGVRPMSDMDILVPFEQAVLAIKILEKEGFELQKEHLLDHNLEYGRSISFEDTDGTEIDLHWHAVVHSHENIDASDFWDAVIPLKIAGVDTLALSFTDNLFHTIVHGIRKNPEPPIRWVADSVILINSEHTPIDWQRLLSYSTKLRVYLQVKKALLYLLDHFNANIPTEVVEELKAYKPSYVERVVFRHGEKIGDNKPSLTFFERLYSSYARYLRQTSKEGFLSIHLGFMFYAGHRLMARITE